ncbi:uncharacterized protein PV09_07027 [Verruconis gallopava]|uniref:Anaphase-promoting complex subunit 11 n=1 Tax=Verruconis gallopava TaxID=253628 RepID=A0A0D2AQV8_9PEZI|nr:uncharacterized protein PV09_07027 [Verruconis gallopava]KIW01549.1 hypothetical protein PV09_07027 [Verruconis gallopava]
MAACQLYAAVDGVERTGEIGRRTGGDEMPFGLQIDAPSTSSPPLHCPDRGRKAADAKEQVGIARNPADHHREGLREEGWSRKPIHLWPRLWPPAGKHPRRPSDKPQCPSTDQARPKAGRHRAPMKVKIKTWNAVAAWRWDMPDEDVCGICRNPYDSTCSKCKFPGDECPLLMGECSHSFHMHCIIAWVAQEQSQEKCPMCRQGKATRHSHDVDMELTAVRPVWKEKGV